MTPIFAIFLLQGEDATSPQLAMPENMHRWLIVSGAVVAVALLLFVWFWLVARPKHRHSHRHQNSRPEPEKKAEVKDEHRHRRRRRRGHTDDHLPRNPTLAETGGLPPVRGAQARQGQRS